MKITLPALVLLLALFCCENKPSTVQTKNRQVIVFQGSPNNNFREVFGDIIMLDENGKEISSFIEDSVYRIKVTGGNQNLKINLAPLTDNLTIEKNGNAQGEFVIKTNRVRPDSTREKIKIDFRLDTAFDIPLIIRRDYPDSADAGFFDSTDYYMNWDSMFTLELRLKEKARR